MNIRPFFYVLFSHLEDASQIKRERKIRKHRNLKFLTMTFLGIMKMSYIAFNNIRWGQISSLYFKISVIKMDSWAVWTNRMSHTGNPYNRNGKESPSCGGFSLWPRDLIACCIAGLSLLCITEIPSCKTHVIPPPPCSARLHLST